MSGGARAAVLAVLALVGCKERGAVVIDLELPATCPGEGIQIYLVRNATCGGCVCDDCLPVCGAGCTAVCPGAGCSLDDLGAGIAVDPPSPGLYALVYVILAGGADGGPPRLSATACTEVEVDADGTASRMVDLSATCCLGGEADGGS